MEDVQLRLLASAILFRTCLRAYPRKPTPEEKMALHRRVEETAWSLPSAMLAMIGDRDVDDGVPQTPAWERLVAELVKPA